MTHLSMKHEKFCIEFAKTGNLAESYVKAGFNAKNVNSASASASRLLKSAKIQARLNELTQKATENQVASVIECQQILTEIARNVRIFPKDRVAALNTLLKAQGAFSQNVNISGAVPVILADDVHE